MKKYYSLTALIITVLILLIGYIAYRQFIYPNYINTHKQTKVLDINQSQIVELIALKNQKNIYSLELEIIGESEENLSILVCDADTLPYNQISLKKGVIDHLQISDWYSETSILQFSTKGNAKINLNYQFLGLN